MNPNVDGGHDIGADDDIGVDEGDGIYICVYVQYGDVDDVDDVVDDVNA